MNKPILFCLFVFFPARRNQHPHIVFRKVNVLYVYSNLPFLSLWIFWSCCGIVLLRAGENLTRVVVKKDELDSNVCKLEATASWEDVLCPSGQVRGLARFSSP